MSDAPTPTVSRRWLAAELRRLREDAHKTLDDVAKVLEVSRAKVSRIELGQVGVHPRDVAAILDLYEIPPSERKELIHLAREARRRSWWHEFRDLDQDSALKQLVDDETAATMVRSFQTLLVFGLFQTEDYARTVLRALRFDLKSDDVDRYVEFRMKRQKLLELEGCPEFWVILDEVSLRRPIGGAETMRRQLNRLAELADHPKVTLQVLPYAAGEHAGLDGAFTIISFPEPGLSDAREKDRIQLENALSDQYLDDPSAVKRYIDLFEGVCQKAYGAEQSRKFILDVSKEL